MAMNRALVDMYVDGMKMAWAPTTQRSTRFRLHGVAAALDGNPEMLWSHMKTHLKPYTRVTTWTNVVGFWDWAMENGHATAGINPYAAFRKSHRRLFENQYVRRPSRFTLNETRERIARIVRPESRKLATDLLNGGMRYTESFTLDKDNFVVGKTGPREILHLPHVDGGKFQMSYMTFVRDLRSVGLKPHDLRKACADHLAKNGFREFDLLAVMGWRSIETAKSYINADERNKLKDRVAAAFKEAKKA